ncbi:hypothetical protein MHBO_003285 [Bonamia ostreae]|uniref:Uncharacterized protein n=1 Tax=Bonamia ostreae TaxID=126728 RepID=A0ABV2APZ9_9EUKA
MEYFEIMNAQFSSKPEDLGQVGDEGFCLKFKFCISDTLGTFYLHIDIAGQIDIPRQNKSLFELKL